VCGQEYQYDRTSDLATANTNSARIPAYTHAPDAPDSHVNAPRVEDKITQCPEPFTGPSEPISESDPDDDPANFNHVRIRTKTRQSQVAGQDDTAPLTDTVESGSDSDSDWDLVWDLAEDERSFSSPTRSATARVAPAHVPTYIYPGQYSYVSQASTSTTPSDWPRRASPVPKEAIRSPRRPRRASHLQNITNVEDEELVDASQETTTTNRTTAGHAIADNTSDELDVNSKLAKAAPKFGKATENDALRAGIPAGYSYRNWDPNEEPIMLLGSVFDANSLGKWIYDWTVFYNGPATPLSELAGELWLLLIQLAGKVKRAEETMPRIRMKESHEIVENFLDSAERLWIRFAKLLKICEDYIMKKAKEDADGADVKQLGKNSGLEFVNSIFGRDRELEKTEKLMTGMRLWSMRFDSTCDEILKHPSA
jgi:hypothetical protein